MDGDVTCWLVAVVMDELVPPGSWWSGFKAVRASPDLLSPDSNSCGNVGTTGVPKELTWSLSPWVVLSRRSPGSGSFLGVDVEEEAVRTRSRQRR